jgi:hypothetical protein
MKLGPSADSEEHNFRLAQCRAIAFWSNGSAGHSVIYINNYVNAKPWPVNDWKNRLSLHYFGRMEDSESSQGLGVWWNSRSKGLAPLHSSQGWDRDEQRVGR